MNNFDGFIKSFTEEDLQFAHEEVMSNLTNIKKKVKYFIRGP